MKWAAIRIVLFLALAFAAVAQLSGCASNSMNSYVGMDDRECLARVMYFESLRNSEEGMLAVGTVVMNRLESGRYPNSVCGVIGQRNQFAPGALTKPMAEGRSAALARRVAGNVLAGQRYPGLAKNVMFFHTHGYHFPYTNMRYVLVAGGNIFYYKDSRRYASATTPSNAQLLAYVPEANRETAPQNEPSAAVATASGEPSADAPTPRAQPAEDASAAPGEAATQGAQPLENAAVAASEPDAAATPPAEPQTSDIPAQ